jgi:signal transduction histidine kinase
MEKFNEDMKKQIGFMSHTIDDFKDFYKPNKAKIRLNIKDELLKVISLLENSYAKEDIKIIQEFCNDCYVDGYQNELGQCFLSLMENSKDAFKELCIPNKKIIVSISSDEKHCTIILKDNAGGIPIEIIDKVFDPYFSTKGDPKGTGLGLYMVKMIIQRHLGGYVNIQNTKEGTEFIIRIEK